MNEAQCVKKESSLASAIDALMEAVDHCEKATETMTMRLASVLTPEMPCPAGPVTGAVAEPPSSPVIMRVRASIRGVYRINDRLNDLMRRLEC